MIFREESQLEKPKRRVPLYLIWTISVNPPFVVNLFLVNQKMKPRVLAVNLQNVIRSSRKVGYFENSEKVSFVF